MTEAKDPKDPKEGESFFRKVVRFVANPGTDWTDLNSRQEDARELELEKSELKAMIERKRRNDFVRKREFDMLRKVRREGLSPDQLAALGSSSKLDDSEVRADADSRSSRTDVVKAKIDEIEQQMVGEGGHLSGSPAPAARKPVYFEPRPLPSDAALVPTRPPLPPLPDLDLGAEVVDDEQLPALPPLPDPDRPSRTAPAAVQMSAGLPPLAPRSAPTRLAAGEPSMARPPSAPPAAPLAPARPMTTVDFDTDAAVEVSEVMHDPDLDEAVISFANADFESCEHALRSLTGTAGSRHSHAETWLVLFDLYRATGQQPRFESLALDYAQLFGWSAPQWYSLPRLVADAVAEERPRPSRAPASIGWTAPAELDVEAVAKLRSQTLQMPLPWVFDWSGLRRVDAEAAMQLSMLMRLWAGQALEMRWLNGEQLFNVLQEAAPTGVRDADPAFWLTRLDALRLVNRADQFDEAAIDYCVTYEVSPPSWEPTRCNVRVASGPSMSTRQGHSSTLTEPSTGFVESSLIDEGSGGERIASVELSGQLVGDISGVLGALTDKVGLASTISVSCMRLIRMDFIAAGDLLNWVLAKKTENRAVHFVDAHRLVALFFGAMGINEHARVQVRKN